MVKILVGDIFKSKAQTLVNPINCGGIRGKGLALEFKKRFPAMFQDYVVRCRRKEVQLGKPYLYKQSVLPWILLFPTKQYWYSVSKLYDIKAGLRYLGQNYKQWGITSLAVPALGCGLGQLEWSIVRPILCDYLERLEILVEIYPPLGLGASEL